MYTRSCLSSHPEKGTLTATAATHGRLEGEGEGSGVVPGGTCDTTEPVARETPARDRFQLCGAAATKGAKAAVIAAGDEESSRPSTADRASADAVPDAPASGCVIMQKIQSVPGAFALHKPPVTCCRRRYVLRFAGSVLDTFTALEAPATDVTKT